MPKVAMDDKANSMGEIKPWPYAPSWIDCLTAWVTRLPGPNWSYYLGLGLVLLLVQAVVLWGEGAYPIGSLPPIHLFFAAVMPFFLSLFHVLDNTTDAALSTLRPTLKVSEEEYGGLRYRLTTLPPRSTLLVGLAIVIITILIDIRWGNPVSIETPVTAPIAVALVYLIFKINWWIFGTLAYHTVHQLRLINRILTKHTHISPFRMGPLYAFSKLTALTAVGLAAPTYVFFALNPSYLYEPVALVQAFLIMVLAVVIFAWPLLGVRRLLAAEKERMLDEVSLRLEAAFVELHKRMDSGRLEETDDLIKVISILETEQNALNKVATWPWQPETVRYLVSALLLPLALWIIQFVLQRILGP